MPDVSLFHTNDGGEITYENGAATITPDGLAMASYLSMFGGNDEDSGNTADDSKQWWGNLDESDPARHYRSETQFQLRGLPVTSANLLKVEAAAERDHAWMVGTIASGVKASASLTAPDRVEIEIRIQIQDSTYALPPVPAQWAAAAT